MRKRLTAGLLAMMLLLAAAGAETGENPEEQPLLYGIQEGDPYTAYVLVNAPEPAGLLPLPLEGEYTKAIRMKRPDGTETYNLVHLTPEGFRMEESNCRGQDCIGEGEVTLANREERILGSMVICLPNQLMLELMTREEVLAWLGR